MLFLRSHEYLNNSRITSSKIGNNAGERIKNNRYCVSVLRSAIQLNKVYNISNNVIVNK